MLLATKQRLYEQKEDLVSSSQEHIEQLKTSIGRYCNENQQLKLKISEAEQKINNLEEENLNSSIDATKEKVNIENDMGSLLMQLASLNQ